MKIIDSLRRKFEKEGKTDAKKKDKSLRIGGTRQVGKVEKVAISSPSKCMTKMSSRKLFS